jgi:hypothetical protein
LLPYLDRSSWRWCRRKCCCPQRNAHRTGSCPSTCIKIRQHIVTQILVLPNIIYRTENGENVTSNCAAYSFLVCGDDDNAKALGASDMNATREFIVGTCSASIATEVSFTAPYVVTLCCVKKGVVTLSTFDVVDFGSKELFRWKERKKEGKQKDEHEMDLQKQTKKVQIPHPHPPTHSTTRECPTLVEMRFESARRIERIGWPCSCHALSQTQLKSHLPAAQRETWSLFPTETRRECFPLRRRSCDSAVPPSLPCASSHTLQVSAVRISGALVSEQYAGWQSLNHTHSP